MADVFHGALVAGGVTGPKCSHHRNCGVAWGRSPAKPVYAAFTWHRRFAETRAASGSADRKTTSANPTPLREALVCVSGEDDWRKPLLVSPKQGGGACVALGKFDAMHVGHRELAARCAAMGETPFLVSFWGMAEVLGWEGRLPVVAPQDRSRVLQSWAPHCAGRAPRQRVLPFRAIREMPPEDFVEFLARDLGATGVVAGKNYRFGYKARGTAEDLVSLGHRWGMRVEVVEMVGPHGEGGPHASSSLVREAMAAGDMGRVTQLMGRRHRVIALGTCKGGDGAGLPATLHGVESAQPRTAEQEGEGAGGAHAVRGSGGVTPAGQGLRLEGGRLWVPRGALQNLAPGQGEYVVDAGVGPSEEGDGLMGDWRPTLVSEQVRLCVNADGLEAHLGASAAEWQRAMERGGRVLVTIDF